MSLKTKLFIAMTLFPIFGLGAYGIYVYRANLEDKQSYVFQSALTISQTLSKLIRSEIDQALRDVQTATDTIDGNGAILWSLDEQKEVQIMKQLGRKIPNARMIRPDEKNKERFYFAEIVKSDGQDFLSLHVVVSEENHHYANLFLPVSRLKSLLGSSTDYSVALVDRIHYKPLIENSNSNVSFSTQDLSRMLSSTPNGQGAQEAKDAKGTDLLVSFSALPKIPLAIVTSMEKEKAFEAARTLALKTFFICTLLISLCFLAALLVSKALTKAISMLELGTQEIMKGNFNNKLEVTSKDEIGQLTNAFNVMVAKIQVLLSETANKARMESELQTARTVQEMLLPKSENDFSHAMVKGLTIPASECGGDFWYTYETKDCVICMIGDVTGHGVGSALITSAVRATFALAEENKMEDMAELSRMVNTAIHACTKGSKTMTGFFIKLKKASLEIEYVNCSHPSLIVIPGTAPEGFSWQDFPLLAEPIFPPLGQGPKYEPVVTPYQLKSQEQLLMITDGVIDAPNLKGSPFGERRVYKTLEKYVSGDRSQLGTSGDYLKAELMKYSNGAEPYDDVTLLCMKVS